MTAKHVRASIGAVVMLVVIVALLLFAWFPGTLMHGFVVVQRWHMGFRRRTVQTAYGAVPYLDGGRGPAVILLHGFQDNKDTWLDFAGHLTGQFRVLIPDLHGFGENHASSNGDYRPAAQAERVKGFMSALDVAAANVVGVSMGGEIAGAFAARYPEATTTVALFSAAGVRPDTISALGRRLLGGDNIFHVGNGAALDTLIALIGDSGLVLPVILKRAMVAEYRQRNAEWDTVLRQLTEPAMVFLLDSLAPEITPRALVLWGAHDPLFPVSGGHRLAARMPHALFVVLPDCGHLCPATRSAEVAKRYLLFAVPRAGVQGR